MAKKSAHKKVRDRLLSGKSITPLQSLRMYGLQRLAPVIDRLRHNELLPIETELTGNERYATYFITRENLAEINKA